jgi:uncharacterized protein (DUF1015 family)
MVATVGLRGYRPAPEHVASVTAPPYDVIKPGSKLESRLQMDPASLYHITLGDRPKEAFDRLVREGLLVEDDEPAFYVYEQRWEGGARTGVMLAAEVAPYEEHKVIRHEKTFDHKVKGRIALREAIGLSVGPVFHLTRAPIGPLLEEAKQGEPVYELDTDLGGLNDLHGIHSRVFRVPEASELGKRLTEALAPHPLYIADGHHRYHASLLHGQTHHLCYVTGDARIQAYNRVVNGVRKFVDVRDALELEAVDSFHTPPKHAFCLYDGKGSYLLRAKEVPEDVVGRLDCSILERELYPHLGLTHDMIIDLNHFDYYPESALEDMKEVVDRGEYDLAIALHPVSLDELMAVADAGLQNPDIVMPEKSTFFAPKILSGLFLYRHVRR